MLLLLLLLLILFLYHSYYWLDLFIGIKFNFFLLFAVLLISEGIYLQYFASVSSCALSLS